MSKNLLNVVSVRYVVRLLPTAPAGAAISLGVFVESRRICRRLTHSLFDLALWSTLLLAMLVAATRKPPADFAADTKQLVWLLRLAIVKMALPVSQQRSLIVQNWQLFGLILGASLLSLLTLALLPSLASPEIARALSVKSVTMVVALAITTALKLQPDLVGPGVMMSGRFGIALGPTLLGLRGLRGNRPEVAAGLGCPVYGLGTARESEFSQTAGAFACFSMVLSALACGFLPILLSAVR